MHALWEFEHPTVGPVRQPRPPAQFSLTPSNFHQQTAHLGEHNEVILRELGYSAERIQALTAQNVLFSDLP